LLSISVDLNSQRSGVGNQLLKTLEIRFLEQDIKRYKVVAGVSLESANKFYLRNGFILASQIIIHGKDLSNIYVKELIF
jgi:N-acetylglutamate synthase-like GNAT family acetyltransferase